MDQLVQDTFLEMTEQSQARFSDRERRLEIRQAKKPCPELSRFFYTTVGADWGWWDRLDWDRSRWLTHASRSDLTTWIDHHRGNPAGYFELIQHPKNEVEILSFGLLPTILGQGLGKELLSAAIECAWQGRPSRIWLSTCSMDHPRALPNYEAAGFTIFKTREGIASLPDHANTLWPESQTAK